MPDRELIKAFYRGKYTVHPIAQFRSYLIKHTAIRALILSVSVLHI
jgi:hypothetical protein